MPANLRLTAFMGGNSLGRRLQADVNIQVGNVLRGRREGMSQFGIGSVHAGMGSASVAPGFNFLRRYGHGFQKVFYRQ